jgi:ABC-2 type transport system permease protein
MTAQTITSRAHRGRGFGELVKMEGKLAWRTPFGLGLGVITPVFFLFIIGTIPAMKKPAPPPSTLTQFGAFIPVLICMSLALIALIALPIPLVLNRDRGVLRRFATTPVAPSWLLAEQVVINLVLALMTIIIIMAGRALLFGVHLAPQPSSFVLSVALAIAAMFAIGLLIASIPPQPRSPASRARSFFTRCCSSPGSGDPPRTCRRSCGTSRMSPRSTPLYRR